MTYKETMLFPLVETSTPRLVMKCWKESFMLSIAILFQHKVLYVRHVMQH